jgi:hypothetical protein
MAEDAFKTAAMAAAAPEAGSEESLLHNKKGRVVFVKPSFIYGGDSFGLFPPRVNTAYGSAVEELLSTPIVSSLAGALPGLLKVALRPPVSVGSVAGAMAAAALAAPPTTNGMVEELDGTAAINSAAGQPSATGFTDFSRALKAKFEELSSGRERN